MTKATTTLFWRKVDHPGYDSCRLIRLSSGWREYPGLFELVSSS
jgi:hypothetical protein